MRKKKALVVIAGLVLVVVAAGLIVLLSGGTDTTPESWQGIYRHTEHLSELERESISVEIQETDVRTVSLEFRQTKNDASFVTTAQAELPLEKASVLTFTAKTGTALPEEDQGTIYVKLRYIDENTLEICYGDTQAELDACQPIQLSRSAE